MVRVRPCTAIRETYVRGETYPKFVGKWEQKTWKTGVQERKDKERPKGGSLIIRGS